MNNGGNSSSDEEQTGGGDGLGESVDVSDEKYSLKDKLRGATSRYKNDKSIQKAFIRSSKEGEKLLEKLNQAKSGLDKNSPDYQKN